LAQRNSHGCQLEERQEIGAEFIVPSGDATELFELIEEALNLITLAIKCLGPTEAFFAPDHVGNVGDGASCPKMGPDTIGVIGLVGDNDGVAFKIGKEWFRAG
jgi:hypothetical protein